MSNYGLSDEEKKGITSDTNFFGNLAVKWFAIIAGVVIILSLVGAFIIRPAMLDAERKQNTHSQQYVESQRTFLIQKWTAATKLEADIQELEAQNDPTNDNLIAGKKAQLNAFVAEMKERVQLIPSDSVPPDVKSFLNQH
jgi:septal ring factor EnvC (AmiA/AmiB activator)